MTHDEQIATLKLERDAQRDEAIRLRVQLEALEVRVAQLAEAVTSDPWFDWAVELADDLGMSRGPVRAGQAADAWSDVELRERIGGALRARDVDDFFGVSAAEWKRLAEELASDRGRQRRAASEPCACCICRGLEGAMLLPRELASDPRIRNTLELYGDFCHAE